MQDARIYCLFYPSEVLTNQSGCANYNINKILLFSLGSDFCIFFVGSSAYRLIYTDGREPGNGPASGL